MIQHEDNLKFLKAQKSQLDDAILDLQVSLGKNISMGAPKTEDNDTSQITRSEKETVEQILKHEHSAAGIYCQFMDCHASQLESPTLCEDVIGVVASLAQVDDDNLSRLLSEYLGLQTMLAIVCRTYEGVKALESYDGEGYVNKGSGIHGLGASIGRSLEGRFSVICLENLRPYAGEFVFNDPQRKLDIPKPRLPNGDIPSGFLGFAVNMIIVDRPHLFCAISSGWGLRETLFYNIFSRLQVYRTRTEMLAALPSISDGAISLDGGMIKSSGVFSLGSREAIDVTFPLFCKRASFPDKNIELENQITQKKWEKERIQEDIRREQALLDQEKCAFSLRKQEYFKILAEGSSYATVALGENEFGTPASDLVIPVVEDESVRVGGDDEFASTICSSPKRCNHVNVLVEVEPLKVGMKFENWEDIELHYKKYAKQHGFEICRCASSFRANKERRGVTWRCNRWGKPYTQTRRKDRQFDTQMERGGFSHKFVTKKSKKCNCPVMVYASLNVDSLWEVTKVISEHENHIPSPSNSKQFKQHQEDHFTNSMKRSVMNNCDADVRSTNAFACFTEEYGGWDNVLITKQNCLQACIKGEGWDVLVEPSEEKVEPLKVGMKFENWEDIELHFRKYAEQHGFGICRCASSFRANKERRAVTWRCDCWGDPNTQTRRYDRHTDMQMELRGGLTQKLKNTKSMKCNCPAMVYASLNADSLWEVSKVINEHENHIPSQANQHTLTSRGSSH